MVNLDNLKSYNDNTHHTAFSIKKFQRNYRNFFKFKIVSSSLIFFESKISGKRYYLKKESDDYVVVYCFATHFHFNFYHDSLKHLIKKLIKHNLI